MAVPQWGDKTYEGGTIPVPIKSYRCKSRNVDPRPHAPNSTLTHNCKIGIDHEGDHSCICGKRWPQLAGANN